MLPRFYRESITLVASWLVICIFILSVTMNSTTSVSAVEANGVGVYWDSNCSEPRSSIDWGTLTPGSVTSVPVYIRNEVEEPIFFSIKTMNWIPLEASRYIILRCDYNERRIDSNVTLQIELRLSVSHDIKGISRFSFDILVTGSENLLADLNGDGVVDIDDFIIVGIAFGSKPGDPHWKTIADLTKDGIVDIDDIVTIAIHFGEHI